MLIISKKSEKLASAIYLITSFFNDHEPMKWKLRTLASELVSLGILVRDSVFRGQETVMPNIRNIVLEMRSLMTISKSAGLVSDVNHSLLDQELLKYLDTLDLSPDGLAIDSRNAISADFFNIGSEETMNPKDIEKKDRILLKDKNEDNVKGYLKVNPPIHRLSSDKGHSFINKGKNLKEFGAVSVKKNSRQSIIISILKRKREIMIKDVSPLIHGCSEKTIQRELSTMVQTGVLKKTGEKRWSRYSLAHPSN